LKNSQLRNEKIRALVALGCSLAVLYFIPHSLAALAILAALWGAIFYPWRAGELFSFVIAALFFLLQNYVCLKAGIFEFRTKDILLMPYYEPFLWGFYFTALRRFVSGRGGIFHFKKKCLAGLLATAIAFSVFSGIPSLFLAATVLSTLFLFALFHTKLDLYYAACSLVLGFIIEIFGVSTGLWSYPSPDFLGIPYWFATMWISVGVLGYRFLIPLGEWLAGKPT
jgi:hypothetical protein